MQDIPGHSGHRREVYAVRKLREPREPRERESVAVSYAEIGECNVTIAYEVAKNDTERASRANEVETGCS